MTVFENELFKSKLCWGEKYDFRLQSSGSQLLSHQDPINVLPCITAA